VKTTIMANRADMNQPEGRGRRRALLIATSDYAEKNLDNLPAAKNDLVALTAILGSPDIGDFEAVPLLNVSKEVAERHIEQMFKIEAEADDFLILYITGHGVLDDGQSLWFALRDYQKESIRASALEARWIRNILEVSRADRQLIIVDTCFSSMFVEGKSASTIDSADANQVRSAQDELITRPDRNDAFRYYIFACREDENAYADRKNSDRDQLSRLTDAIVSSLTDGSADGDGTGLISLDDLWSRIEARSRNWRDQQPRRAIGMGGRTSGTIVAKSQAAPNKSAGPRAAISSSRLKRERNKIRRRLFRRRHVRGLVAGATTVLLAICGASVYWLTSKPEPKITTYLTVKNLQKINTDGTASFSSRPGGVIQIAVPSGHLQWYGLYYPNPRSCDYTLKFDAKHTAQKAPTNGAGYGVSVRSVWNSSNSTGAGWTMQDEFAYSDNTLTSDLRITDLSNVDTFPYAALGLYAYYGWSHWIIVTRGSIIRVTRNGQLIGTFPVSTPCGGVFFRVWAETTQFRNISLTTY
jgi:hypothetical protein